MNNAVFGKTMEKERKQWYKTCCNRKKKKLFSARIFFAEKLLAIEMKKKTEILMDKPVYLGLSILELKKILMHELWYDYVKPKYGEKSKLRYMVTDSFIVYIKTAIFIKRLQKILKLDLILQIMN